MKHIQTLRAWATAIGLCTMTALAIAGEGHDHGEAPSAAAEPTLARFEAASDQFELVGVLDGRKLTLYLDRAADNSPAKDAALEIEFAGKAVPVKEIGDGTFEATLAADPEEGEHPVSATVVAGQESDLLAAELHVHEAAHADAAESGGASAMSPWLKWALPGLVLVAAGLFFIQRNKRARKGGLA
ncbi:MAG: hypothetical protein IT506_10025 [Aquabacterium sp.]|nr:hypothetical protein [Aquabacterium sp.]